MKQAEVQVLLSALAALSLAAGCVESQNRQHVAVELDGATSAEIRLEMDDAELDIRGGAAALMEADFYFPDSDSPRVYYAVEGQHGALDVRQRHDDNIFTIDNNHWDIGLGGDVPLALAVEMDSGDAELDLGGMMLHRLDFDMWSGDATFDLTGRTYGDLDARIELDMGHVRLRVPASVTAAITIDIDEGEVDADGFARDWAGTYLVEGDPDGPVYRIEVDVDFGEVDLELVD